MEEKSFWTSLPGVLTGTATLLSAIAGFYVVYHPVSNVGPPPPTNVKSSQNAEPNAWANWERIGKFSGAEGLWWTGDADDGVATFVAAFSSGKYRLRAAFRGSRSRWITPYGPLTDFYEAVSFSVPEHSGREIRAGLAFGGTAEIQYEFCLSSTGELGLRSRKGAQVDWIFRSTPVRYSFEDRNRMAVLVKDSSMFFYVNEQLAGKYRVDLFKGGNVGLVMDGEGEGTSAVMDFDDFDLRRPPI